MLGPTQEYSDITMDESREKAQKNVADEASVLSVNGTYNRPVGQPFGNV
jgi:hypothetical protein